MAGQVNADVTALQLEKVKDKVPTLFDRGPAMFYSSIEKKDVERISKRDMRIPLEIRPGGYFGHFNPAGGDLGRGAADIFEKAVVSTVHLKYAVEHTKEAEWATDDSRKAVVKAINHKLAKAMADFRRHVEALAMTDGTAVLGTVGSVTTGSGVDTIVLDSDGFGAKLLRYGQKYHVYDSTLATQRTAVGDAREITYFDIPTKTIKGLAVTGITAGDKIVVDGVSGANPVSLYGVQYHQSGATSGTWLGLDRATVPEIRGNRVNAGTAALALPYARLALNKAGDRLGDQAQKLVAWMHPAQVQAYEELGQLVQVINKEAKGSQGLDMYFGEENMRIAGVPIKKSWYWDKKRIDFIDSSQWGRAEMHPAGFYEVDGRKTFEIRGASGGVATSFVYYLVASFQIFTSNPALGTYIDGLTVPSGY